MDLSERSKAYNFKPLIDEQILQIARWAKIETQRVKDILNLLNASRYSPFEYLYTALRKVKPILFIERVDAQLEYPFARSLFNSSEQQHVFVGETAYDYDPADLEAEDYAIILENYPKEAHLALKQGSYWGGKDENVVGVWLAKDRIERIYLATPTSFHILAEDAVEFIEKIVTANFAGQTEAEPEVEFKPDAEGFEDDEELI
jgi:hypothetical protein